MVLPEAECSGRNYCIARFGCLVEERSFIRVCHYLSMCCARAPLPQHEPIAKAMKVKNFWQLSSGGACYQVCPHFGAACGLYHVCVTNVTVSLPSQARSRSSAILIPFPFFLCCVFLFFIFVDHTVGHQLPDRIAQVYSRRRHGVRPQRVQIRAPVPYPNIFFYQSPYSLEQCRPGGGSFLTCRAHGLAGVGVCADMKFRT